MTKLWKLKKYQIKNQVYFHIGKYFHKYYKLKPKVFGIGLNRTGSSSLGTYFQMLGYKHSFETYTPEQLRLFISDKNALKKEMDRFEMHEDWPSAKVYKTLAELYPDAKFILTMRDTPEQWFNSLKNTTLEEGGLVVNKIKELIYGYGIITDEHKDELIKIYNSHFEEVTNFFRDKNQLLILKTSDENKEGKINKFLNITNSNLSYPHSQKRQYGK